MEFFIIAFGFLTIISFAWFMLDGGVLALVLCLFSITMLILVPSEKKKSEKPSKFNITVASDEVEVMYGELFYGDTLVFAKPGVCVDSLLDQRDSIKLIKRNYVYFIPEQ